MNIPQSNILNTRALGRIFDKMSESYKIFWFKAIIEKIAEGKSEITFDELINNMIKDAWYMVSEFKLNLGPNDTLEKLVNHSFRLSKIKTSAKPEKILEYIKNADDREQTRMKKTLTINVPYRLQATFLPEISENIWASRKAAAQYINMQPGLIYKFSEESGLEKKILVNPLWAQYIKDNLVILHGWADYNLIVYLQKRNPSVPGISTKIYPPMERKLVAASAYFKAVVAAGPVENIYSGEPLTTKDFSIDHFVPWSYVAHDELWNLVPTTKSVNSSKSNNLPRWEKYFSRLSKLEYKAYSLANKYDHVRELFEKCKKEHLNSNEVRQRLYRPGLSEDQFTFELEEILTPVYESAKNMGFGEWEKYET